MTPPSITEVHYRLLQGPYGAAIAQMTVTGSNMHKISQIIRRIKAQLAEPIRVRSLRSSHHSMDNPAPFAR